MRLSILPSAWEFQLLPVLNYSRSILAGPVHRWWLVVIVLFALCVAFRLNGSSVGVWQEVLREPGPPRGLLLFKPERIRADEWRVVTPSMLSQARQSRRFPIENESLGAGRAPLLMSVPVAYYTTFFRPQLWGFFLLDFERGFSFYWCCKVFGLLLAAVWLLRQIGIKNVGVLAFGALWIFFSSFVQWWFSTPAMLPEMMASWAMATGFTLQFFSKSSPRRLTFASLGFVFFGVNFVLCLYPGFQVPLLYVSVAIVIGIWLQRRATEDWQGKQGLMVLGVALALLILILVPFWLSVRDTLQIVAQTVYPGPIRSRGGGLSLFSLLSGAFGFFESENHVLADYANSCEASNFYPLWVPVVVAVVMAKWRSRTPVPPLLIALAVPLVLLSIYCLIPLPRWLAQTSLLGFATVTRLLLGIGIANILLCCVFLDSYRSRVLPGGVFAGSVAFLCLAAGFWMARPFTDMRLVSTAVINAFLISLFFWERARPWFLAAFAALIISNGIGINPVMTGLSPLLEANAFRKIGNLHAADPENRWIVYENLNLAQMVKATGARVLNGTRIVPDMEFMQELAPQASDRMVWNRYATIAVELPGYGSNIAFQLVYDDLYLITLPPELPLLRSRGYGYLVFPRNWSNANLHGFSLVEQIEPAQLFIYKRDTDQP